MSAHCAEQGCLEYLAEDHAMAAEGRLNDVGECPLWGQKQTCAARSAKSGHSARAKEPKAAIDYRNGAPRYGLSGRDLSDKHHGN